MAGTRRHYKQAHGVLKAPPVAYWRARRRSVLTWMQVAEEVLPVVCLKRALELAAVVALVVLEYFLDRLCLRRPSLIEPRFPAVTRCLRSCSRGASLQGVVRLRPPSSTKH